MNRCCCFDCQYCVSVTSLSSTHGLFCD